MDMTYFINLLELANKDARKQGGKDLFPIINESEILEWIEEVSEETARVIVENKLLYRMFIGFPENEIYPRRYPLPDIRILDKAFGELVRQYMERFDEIKYNNVIIIRLDVRELFSRGRHSDDYEIFDRADFEKMLVKKLRDATIDKFNLGKEEFGFEPRRYRGKSEDEEE
jgi:hypothetical protein